MRRGKPRRNALESFKLLYNNINGIKTKQRSLQQIIDDERPTIIGISETKLNEKDTLKIEGYKVKRVDRKTDGGGVLIAYKKCLKKLVLVVREEREDEEMLWLKLDNGKVKMRIGIVYMPQENETRKEVIQGIYKKI